MKLLPIMTLDRGKKLSLFFDRHRTTLISAILFCIPIKLSLTYALLIPILLLWLIGSGRNIPKLLGTLKDTVIPLVIFLVVAVFSSFFGLNFLNSVTKLARLSFFSLSIFMFYGSISKATTPKMILALLLGQTTAAVHTIISNAFPKQIPSLFVGHVTESGQLSLTIIIALGLIFFLNRREEEDAGMIKKRRLIFNIGRKYEIFPALVSLLACNLLAFHRYLQMPKFFILFFAITLACGLVLIIYKLAVFSFTANSISFSTIRFYLLTYILPVLFSALLVNLKRGPWAGVFVAGLILFFLFSKRLILPIVLAAVLILLALAPVRERLTQSSRHFFISGGRSVIWEIGTELSARYPLGIGFENSSFLQNYDREIPKNLDHFHNNFLNITVETGWLGIGIFIWWICLVLGQAFKRYSHDSATILAGTIGCAVISWQIAGVVEYNFGDSEVLLVVFFLLALLAGIPRMDQQPSSSS